MLNFLKRYAAKYWGYYVIGLAMLLATNYLATVIPLHIKDVINLYEAGKGDQINTTLGWLVVLAVLLAITRSFSRIWIFIPGRYIEFDIRKDLYLTFLTLSSTYFRKEKIGDLMSRLVNDIQNLRLTAAMGFLHIFNTAFIFTFVIYHMFRIDIPLTLILMAPIPLVLLSIKSFVKKMYLYTQTNQQSLSQLTDFIVESLTGLTTVKSNGAEALFYQHFLSINEEYLAINIKLARIRSIIFPFIGIIGSIGHIILLLIGGFHIIDGRMSIGDFVAFISYLSLLAWPIASLAWIINILQRGRVSWTRISEILSQVPDIKDTDTTDPTLTITEPPSLEIRDLTFTYPSQDDTSKEPTLSHISLTLKPRQKIGIFGPVGCGKTTLINLLARLEKAPENSVFVNDIPIERYGLDNYRKAISYVSQTPFLFSNTISENIAFAENTPVTDQQLPAIEKSATRAEVWHDISMFPKKLDTLIGEKGIVLSGGQKSRIALARAFYKQCQLLILDDVLSAVDHKTEHHLINEINALDVTTLIISQRVSALETCDKIIVLNKGKIVDQGTHAELLSRENSYKHTWQYQKLVTNNDT